ncbi:hypothetical protein TrLO_g10515 [Triparma laevis f. longispina]|uniref:Uncharacterized protein n=1 Tax=Triparma laevis f. longispina TaxID=1714387 RepID=A0A9W7FNN4_9STRA|nr:hypothetical protein TrLO_g10515 [Triparma laevis f. longispina]
MTHRLLLAATSALLLHLSNSFSALATFPKTFNPKFFPHAPYIPPSPLLKNQHIQTIGGAFFRDPPPVPSNYIKKRERVNTPDSDFFHVDILRPSTPKTNPKIAVILHGLESTSTSPLCKSLSSSFIDSGIDEIHCICFRGCSGVPNLTPGAYHLGFTSDLKLYLNSLPQSSEKYLSAFSLGANVILKCLGELGQDAIKLNVKAASLLCVPFDCTLCQPKLDASGFNKNVYSRNFLKTLIQKTELQYYNGLMEGVDGFDIERVRRCTTIGEFDNSVVAPIYNFSNKQDYYRQSSCLQYLEDVEIPFLVINANDDPFFDKDCYVDENDYEMMKAIYTEEGGHCGYLGGWAEETMGDFFKWVNLQE